MTSYVIFSAIQKNGAGTGGDDRNLYACELGVIEASSAEQAVRKHAEKAGTGTYIALPAKQFKPLPVQVETVQRVKVG